MLGVGGRWLDGRIETHTAAGVDVMLDAELVAVA